MVSDHESYFEGRALKPYAEPVFVAELKEGNIYFAVNYVDEDMLIPTMETLVFIGRDLESGDSGSVYFQDIFSYRKGVRYGSTTEGDHAEFYAGSAKEVGHIFTFERALEALMSCSLRRRKAEQQQK
jgi:hypothetical protein